MEGDHSGGPGVIKTRYFRALACRICLRPLPRGLWRPHGGDPARGRSAEHSRQSRIVLDHRIPASDQQGIALGPDHRPRRRRLVHGKRRRENRQNYHGRSGLRIHAPRSQLRPSGITTGPDGNLWFTAFHTQRNYFAASYIGSVTTAGKLQARYLLARKALPESIVTGPDGNLWFTEEFLGRIGRVTTSGKLRLLRGRTARAYVGHHDRSRRQPMVRRRRQRERR